MTTEKIDLRGSAATLLLTLYLRAWDARQRRPILGDRYAADVLARVEFDDRLLRWATGDASAVTCRARTLDDWTRRFLDRHPDAQVLHLGCGLDSRPLRVELPGRCRWLDVDQSEVIDLRRRLYDLPGQVECVPTSVTDDAWWTTVATDRRTLVVAEGLLMYLSGEDVHRVVDRITALPSGELAFDAVAPWTVAVSRWSPQFRSVGTRFRWGWDGDGFTTRHPDLSLIDEVSVYDMAAEVEPRIWLRAAMALTSTVPPLRDAMRLRLYRIG